MSRVEIVFPFIIPSKTVIDLLKDKGYEAELITESENVIGEVESFNYMVTPIHENQTYWIKTQYYIKAKNKDEEVIFFAEYNNVIFNPVKKYNVDINASSGLAMSFMTFQTQDSIVQKIITKNIPLGYVIEE